MNNIKYVSLLILILISCDKKEKQNSINNFEKHFTTLSYLDIKLDENGHLPSNPYVLEFKNGKKKIVFCGVEHLTDNNDINNQMFSKIENKFYNFNPDICVNEGGDISNKIYRSKEDALLKDGEIGLTKILADSLKIKTVNGDPNVEYEFKELLKYYSIGEFLTYIVTERLMWSLVGEKNIQEKDIENRYNLFIENYIIKSGKVKLKSDEKKFSFYTTNYQKLVGRKFNLADLKPTNPFDANGTFQEVGRKSKNIRDQFLLKTIDKLLNKYDKVFIVFGGWHLLTCEPGLKEIIERKR
jgi:hypothetical protein